LPAGVGQVAQTLALSTPTDTPPPVPEHSLLSSTSPQGTYLSLATFENTELPPGSFTNIPCQWTKRLRTTPSPSQANLLLDFSLGTPFVVPLQHPPAKSHLVVQETPLLTDGPPVLCVLNPDPTTVRLKSGSVLAKVIPAQVMTPLSDDIRLLPVYRDYIAKMFNVNLALFQETFTNGGNFVNDDWSKLTSAWINPPWHLLSQTIEKLIVQSPCLWILVCPVFAPPPIWYQVLHAADNLRYLRLPRTMAPGFFVRFKDDICRSTLPFPSWDVEIVYGNRSSFQLLDYVQRSQLTQRLITHSSTVPPLWKTILSVPPEHTGQLIELLSNYADLLDGTRLGRTSAA